MSARQVASYATLFPYVGTGDEFIVYKHAMNGSLRESPVRGLAWRYFLGVLRGPTGTWAQQVEAQCTKLEALCAEHCVDPSAVADAAGAAGIDVAVVNPLSCDESSPFQKFFEFAEVREQIENDLKRLYPGDEFFARADVQRSMQRILCVWAAANPEVGYRQGMHELLAPLLSVNWHEAAEAAAAAEAPRAASDYAAAGTLLRAVLRPDAVEGVTWGCFAQLMRGVREYYFKPPRVEPDAPSPLQRTCTRIQGDRLLACDPALHARLTSLGVEPQLYLLRWLRLLFGREFHLADVQVVWDAIFAYASEELRTGGGPAVAPPADAPSTARCTFVLVEDFALAMLMYVREELLSNDFNRAMKRLLKFPPVGDVRHLVERALQLRRAHQQRVGTKVRMPRHAPQSRGASAPSENATPSTGSYAAAAASEATAAATSSLADPWTGSCSHLRTPPEWPPPKPERAGSCGASSGTSSTATPSLPPTQPQPSLLPPTLEAVLRPPDKFARPAEASTDHPLGGAMPASQTATLAPAATAALPVVDSRAAAPRAWPVPLPPVPADTPDDGGEPASRVKAPSASIGTAASGDEPPVDVSPPSEIPQQEMAGRIDRALRALREALQAAHPSAAVDEQVVAAVGELKAVRDELLRGP